MSFKCPLCMQIFSQRFAYTQYAQKCLKNVEVEEDDDDSEKYSSEMDTRSNQSSDKVEVIMLFQIIHFEALKKKLRYTNSFGL